MEACMNMFDLVSGVSCGFISTHGTVTCSAKADLHSEIRYCGSRLSFPRTACSPSLQDTSGVDPDADRALERFTMFCPGGPTKAVHAGDKCRHDQADANKDRSKKQKTDRQLSYKLYVRRRDIHDAIDSLDVVMMYRVSAKYSNLQHARSFVPRNVTYIFGPASASLFPPY